MRTSAPIEGGVFTKPVLFFLYFAFPLCAYILGGSAEIMDEDGRRKRENQRLLEDLAPGVRESADTNDARVVNERRRRYDAPVVAKEQNCAYGATCKNCWQGLASLARRRWTSLAGYSIFVFSFFLPRPLSLLLAEIYSC